MSHIWMSHVAHMNESCHTYERVMSHIWMSHVTHMNEWYCVCRWVMSHIDESCHTYSQWRLWRNNPVMDEWCCVYRWDMSHIFTVVTLKKRFCECTQLCDMCDVTHSYVWYDASIYYSNNTFWSLFQKKNPSKKFYRVMNPFCANIMVLLTDLCLHIWVSFHKCMSLYLFLSHICKSLFTHTSLFFQCIYHLVSKRVWIARIESSLFTYTGLSSHIQVSIANILHTMVCRESPFCARLPRRAGFWSPRERKKTTHHHRVYIYIYMYIYAYTHTHTHVRARAHTHTHAHTHAHKHTHARKHTHKHTRPRTHAYRRQ